MMILRAFLKKLPLSLNRLHGLSPVLIFHITWIPIFTTDEIEKNATPKIISIIIFEKLVANKIITIKPKRRQERYQASIQSNYDPLIE